MFQVEALWQFLMPLMRTALSRITVETYTDWGTCVATACVSSLTVCVCVCVQYIMILIRLFAGLLVHVTVCVVLQESRDPRKLHWLLEMLMESPLSGEGGSFVDAWSVSLLVSVGICR